MSDPEYCSMKLSGFTALSGLFNNISSLIFSGHKKC